MSDLLFLGSFFLRWISVIFFLKYRNLCRLSEQSTQTLSPLSTLIPRTDHTSSTWQSLTSSLSGTLKHRQHGLTEGDPRSVKVRVCIIRSRVYNMTSRSLCYDCEINHRHVILYVYKYRISNGLWLDVILYCQGSGIEDTQIIG